MIKYADDTSIVGRMYTNDDNSLQSYNNEIFNFTNWCVDNYLEINVGKTKEIIVDFRRKKKTTIPDLKINGQSVERVSEYKYLGTVIDDQLTFDANTKYTVRKLQQRLFFLRKLNSFNIDKTILEMFYITVVQSVLSFSLVCVFGNMRSRDKGTFHRVVKQAQRITKSQLLLSPEVLYNAQVCSKVDLILSDPSHPLYPKFVSSSKGCRLLQRKIRTQRFNNSFVQTAIRFYNL